MRATIARAPGAALRPVPGPGEALIRVRAAVFCVACGSSEVAMNARAGPKPQGAVQNRRPSSIMPCSASCPEFQSKQADFGRISVFRSARPGAPPPIVPSSYRPMAHPIAAHRRSDFP